MTYAVKKQMVKMALKAGEILVFEMAVPMVMDFAENKLYPAACEKWDEFVAKKETKNHNDKVVKFNKRHVG